jgi:hypothetical protein
VLLQVDQTVGKEERHVVGRSAKLSPDPFRSVAIQGLLANDPKIQKG